MDKTPDKPRGSERHPPGRNPERQGPDPGQADDRREEPSRDTAEPHPEEAPGRPGVTRPKQGKV